MYPTFYWKFQGEIDFTMPEVTDIGIPTSIGPIFKMKLLFKCDEGKFCDNVDVLIRGCAQGSVHVHCNFNNWELSLYIVIIITGNYFHSLSCTT